MIAAHSSAVPPDTSYPASFSGSSGEERHPSAEWLKIGHLAVFAQSLYLDPEIRPSLGDVLGSAVFRSPSTLRQGGQRRDDVRISSCMVTDDARLSGLSFVTVGIS